MMVIVMKFKNIEKNYQTKDEKIIALSCFSYEFNKGLFYAVMGPSGSGKSTLIKILGLMEDVTSGEYILDDINIFNVDDNAKAELRMNKIGFVFQDYKLDSYLTALENVMLPMLINNSIKKQEREKRALDLLNIVGMSDRKKHFPRELSGGEQQRVCIARALANTPDYILADEPTGNLDEDNEKIVLDLLKSLSDNGKCVICISHSNEILKYADKVLVLKKGKLVDSNEI